MLTLSKCNKMNSSTFKRKYEEQLRQAKTFNLGEVAYYMRCCKNTITNYVNTKGFPREGGRGTGIEPYYIKEDVDKWVKEHPRFALH